jgi:hypothetical protein
MWIDYKDDNKHANICIYIITVQSSLTNKSTVVYSGVIEYKPLKRWTFNTSFSDVSHQLFLCSTTIPRSKM